MTRPAAVSAQLCKPPAAMAATPPDRPTTSTGVGRLVAKYLGDGVSELRFDLGPGYRVYFHRRGDIVVVLLCGGDKKTQASDIEKAKAIVSELEW